MSLEASPLLELETRINRVINTSWFAETLKEFGIDLIEFQCEWDKTNGDFEALPEGYRRAIESGEAELDMREYFD